MGKEQLSQLERHGSYISVPRGRSMWPMIRSGKDAVMIRTLKRPPVKYDLVLYIRGKEQGVIHRVFRRRKNDYVIIGDNCWQYEYVRPEQIVGLVTEFCRKGKWHKVNEPLYKLYVHIWMDFLAVKRPLFYARDKAYSLLAKMRHNMNTAK